MKNISETPYGFRVDIVRTGARFTGFVSFKTCGGIRAEALRRAQAMHAEALAKFGPVRARSNTGVAGITEIVHWTNSVPQPCFVVTVGKPCPNWKRRFFYRTDEQRTRAFRAAIAHRARQAGEDAAKLMEAACA